MATTVVVKNNKFILTPIDIDKLKSGDLINEEKQLVVKTSVEIPAERSPPSDVKGEEVKVTRVIDGNTIEDLLHHSE